MSLNEPLITRPPGVGWSAATVAAADGAAEPAGAALGAQADARRASPVTKAMARQEIAFKEKPPLPADLPPRSRAESRPLYGIRPRGPRGSAGACCYPGKWHAAQCRGECSLNSGSTSEQICCAFQHRVWKRQPLGGFTGLGTSPVRMIRLRFDSTA